MKQYISDLAVFGGTPEFEETLHVGRPNVGNRQKLFERFDSMLDHRWLTNNGPFVQEFERKLSELLGVKHCIAINNATIALEIAIKACGLSGEVIVPSFTFVATAHALQWQGITPVFCDIDPQTHNIDPDRIQSLITPRTTGIVGVHVWGRACEVDALSRIADQYNLNLLFDAAHAFTCSYKQKMIGSFGRAEVFSFHATKFFNTFEGGAIVTNDDELDRTIRMMKNFGFVGYDRVEHVGTNGKMTEVSAAMGLTNLESLQDFVQINKRNYECYRARLNHISGIRFHEYDEKEHNNYQYIVLELNQADYGVSRDMLFHILHAENILARRYFYPGCHQMEPYRSFFPNAKLLLPETEKLTQKVMVLPSGTAVSPEQIERVCDLIQFIGKHGREICLAYPES